MPKWYKITITETKNKENELLELENEHISINIRMEDKRVEWDVLYLTNWQIWSTNV